MTIDTSHVIHPDHVVIHCQGSYEIESTLAAYARAFEIAESNHVNAVLFEALDLTGTPPTVMDRFTMGKYVSELYLTYGGKIRMAIVGSEPYIDPDRFGETVATNRGGDVGVFTSMTDALAWLDVKDPKATADRQ